MPNTFRTAVIGLGSMGYGVAQSCLRGGHVTYGFDVVPSQIERLQSEGGAKGDLADIAGTLDVTGALTLDAGAGVTGDIDFIDNVYENVRTPLNFVCNSINNNNLLSDK